MQQPPQEDIAPWQNLTGTRSTQAAYSPSISPCPSPTLNENPFSSPMDNSFFSPIDNNICRDARGNRVYVQKVDIPNSNPPTQINNQSKTTSKSFAHPIIQIRPSTTTQWHWPRSYCRTWLEVVLIFYLDFEERRAKEKASEFPGFGPDLYAWGLGKWYAFLGERVDGVYMLLQGMGHCCG